MEEYKVMKSETSALMDELETAALIVKNTTLVLLIDITYCGVENSCRIFLYPTGVICL